MDAPTSLPTLCYIFSSLSTWQMKNGMHFICIMLIVNESEHLLILLVIFWELPVFSLPVFILCLSFSYWFTTNFMYIKKVSCLSSICYKYFLPVHLVMSMLMVISCHNFYVVLLISVFIYDLRVLSLEYKILFPLKKVILKNLTCLF